MNQSQFAFLASEFGEQYATAEWAERHALSDPGPAIIYARKTLETGVKWVFRHDRALALPYDDKLNAYLSSPAYKQQVNGHLYSVSKKIQRAGNKAVHESKVPTQLEAVEVVSALYEFCFWLAFTYGRSAKPDPQVRFDPRRLPGDYATEQSSLKERRDLEERLDREVAEAAEARRRSAELEATVEQLEAERAALMEQVAAAKQAAQAVSAEAHDWSEWETRQYKIDTLLAEAAWRLTEVRDREYEVHGMPTDSGVGYVDYVLWGDNGLPLAVVEAKKTLVSPKSGQQQARLYADCLEHETGQRPLIYTTNGYEHWLWDDARYPPRPIRGFHTHDELTLLIQRRTTAKRLDRVDVDSAIAGRHYQERAIRAIAEYFEVDRQRKALLVMATGAGKTRTVIALVDLLMRANLAKRVLFLADRIALVRQTVNAFKQHLPASAPVNLVTEPDEDGRVYVSTYQSMVGKIDEMRSDGTRRFGVGHFDLVVIDEAHRSVYRKYRGIFEYFDSLLVGLTATPKDEVDRNTYDLFDLESGVPTDAYPLDDAVGDGYLVPPRGVSVPLKFVRAGIRYDELPEDEKDRWDEIDWGDDDEGASAEAPGEISAGEVNKWLFNEDTIDKVLEQLMTDGVHVAGGDRLGKTIVFAKNQRHADFIYDRFIANYPHLDNGNFARVVTHEVRYAQSLIDDFSNKEKAPHIAISVDMLDTGIDIPEVVNLVFFKLVRSKAKFWQMLGRGTRLCPDLFGPGQHKTHFLVFDYCQNLEFFSQELAPAEPTGGTPLHERLFRTRLELLQALDRSSGEPPEARSDVADLLCDTVRSMNPDNFLVRPHLRLVERFSDRDAWDEATIGDLAELSSEVAGLPDQLDPDHEDSKRFDVLVLTAQLALLEGVSFERQRTRIMQLASALEDQQSIPVIQQQLALILDVQDAQWWIDVSYPMLEEVRRKLRGLVPLIERRKKQPIYSDFTDEIGPGVEVDLPGAGGTVKTYEYMQFRRKAQHFLRENLGEEAVAKVRSGQPLTTEDLADLQRILVAAGIGDDTSFQLASERAGDLGSFVRSLVGLDRSAAKTVFADFLDDKRYSRRQIDFINLIIDELTHRGVVEAHRVYESPYDAVAPQGPESLFSDEELDRIFEMLERLAAQSVETS